MFMKHVFRLLGIIFLLHIPGLAENQEDLIIIPQLTIKEEKGITTAGAQDIRDRDLQLRPIFDPSDIIKVTPGLYTATHAGGGKAYQYFMRGFDIDHGTDLAFWLDNIPVNNVSHGHGQGYTDLHFIIPELIESIEVRKGPYHPEFGDFATAGALRLRMRKRISHPGIKLSGGMFGTGRIFAAVNLDSSKTVGPYLALETYRSDGPFKDEEKLERYNGVLRMPLIYSDDSELWLSAMSYLSGWNASGQIPQRAVKSGELDRFGSIDPSEGGNSQRNSVSLDYTKYLGQNFYFDASAYVISYRLGLYSNFTFFLEDSVNGDEIEQIDNRKTVGFSAKYSHQSKLWKFPLKSVLGIQNRNDWIHTELGHAVKRRRTGTIINSDIQESSLGLYVNESLKLHNMVTFNVGMRGDLYAFYVRDLLPGADTAVQKTSGVAHQSIGSPKANLVFSPFKNLDIFVNIGKGFHSNDARGTVLNSNPVTPLSSAWGYELGARTKLFDKWDLGADIWKLDLQSELVWIGDAGTTEASGETERLGVDFESRFELLKWLWWDGDVSFSRGTYTQENEGENTVANAPGIMLNTGLSLSYPSGLYGSLRYSKLGDRPLNEEESIVGNGMDLINLNLGYRFKHWDISMQVENLLNAEYAVTQFATESMLKGEMESVEEVHFVPGNPINIKGHVAWYF